MRRGFAPGLFCGYGPGGIFEYSPAGKMAHARVSYLLGSLEKGTGMAKSLFAGAQEIFLEKIFKKPKKYLSIPKKIGYNR